MGPLVWWKNWSPLTHWSARGKCTVSKHHNFKGDFTIQLATWILVLSTWDTNWAPNIRCLQLHTSPSLGQFLETTLSWCLQIPQNLNKFHSCLREIDKDSSVSCVPTPFFVNHMQHAGSDCYKSNCLDWHKYKSCNVRLTFECRSSINKSWNIWPNLSPNWSCWWEPWCHICCCWIMPLLFPPFVTNEWWLWNQLLGANLCQAKSLFGADQMKSFELSDSDQIWA
jgi:hypothetical protein